MEAALVTDIALFLPSLHGGGAERVMLTLANAMSARGYAVDLVLGTADGAYLKDVSPTLRIIDLKCKRVIRALVPLARYLRQQRPKAMLSALNHANIIAITANTFAGGKTRLVVSEHSTISVEASRARTLAAKVIYLLISKTYRQADGVIAVSKNAAEDLQHFSRLPAGSVRAIYNPFDLGFIARQAERAPEHPWLAPGQPPLVIAIGRLTEPKDFPVLIRAFARVRAQRVARLLILGEGELRIELSALIAKVGLTNADVQLPGFVPNPFSYLARSSVFVLSSRWEGLPSVLIEAMACGTPVVSTDCPSGPREILEDGRWGPLVPPGDVESLAQAIESVLATPRDLLPDVRTRAKDFDQRIAVDAYLDALGVVPATPQNEQRANPRNGE